MNSTAKRSTDKHKATLKKNNKKKTMPNIKREHKMRKYPDIESMENIHNEYNVEEVRPFSFEEEDCYRHPKEQGMNKDMLTLAIQSINI